MWATLPGGGSFHLGVDVFNRSFSRRNESRRNEYVGRGVGSSVGQVGRGTRHCQSHSIGQSSVTSLRGWGRGFSHVRRMEQVKASSTAALVDHRESVFLTIIIPLNYITLHARSNMFLRIIALDPHRKVVSIPIL